MWDNASCCNLRPRWSQDYNTGIYWGTYQGLYQSFISYRLLLSHGGLSKLFIVGGGGGGGMTKCHTLNGAWPVKLFSHWTLLHQGCKNNIKLHETCTSGHGKYLKLYIIIGCCYESFSVSNKSILWSIYQIIFCTIPRLISHQSVQWRMYKTWIITVNCSCFWDVSSKNLYSFSFIIVVISRY